jgi:O-antigen ligase
MVDTYITRMQSSLRYHKFVWFLWYLLLLSIPVTSSPVVAFLTRGSVVSPLAGIPLGLLVMLWLLPEVLRGERLPEYMKPLLLFVVVAISACAAAYFLKLFPFLGQSVFLRELRALFTLAIGVCFFLIGAKIVRTEERLRSSLRWLYIGGVGTLIWSTIQAIFIFSNYGEPLAPFELPFPNMINIIHRLFSIRDLLPNRVTGFAYEPSFLANQMVLLYLPLWLASVVRGFSVFNRKLSGLSLELVFAVWGFLIVLLSQSRIGLLSTFVLLGVLGMLGAWRLSGRVDGVFREKRSDRNSRYATKSRLWIRILVWLLLLILVVVIFLAVLQIASRLDPRLERLFNVDYLTVLSRQEEPVYSLASILSSAERAVYWHSSFRVFSLYPILGVGLGNEGFLFREAVPAFGSRLTEIVRILNGSPQFPNPKNLWIRLLAETGIIGFLTFVVWLLIMLLGARSLFKRNGRMQGAIGLAGILALFAQIIEGFSLDSFALPQLWIMLGFVAAVLAFPRSKSSPVEAGVDAG